MLGTCNIQGDKGVSVYQVQRDSVGAWVTTVPVIGIAKELAGFAHAITAVKSANKRDRLKDLLKNVLDGTEDGPRKRVMQTIQKEVSNMLRRDEDGSDDDGLELLG